MFQELCLIMNQGLGAEYLVSEIINTALEIKKQVKKLVLGSLTIRETGHLQVI